MNKSVDWIDSELKIIDQTLLPHEKKILILSTLDAVVEAITKLRIRGAPAIGVAAAYGILVALNEGKYAFKTACERLSASRPTAVNLFWAIKKMSDVYDAHIDSTVKERYEALEQMAVKIHDNDIKSCLRIAENGQILLKNKLNIMTICNTGFLATGGIGTALGVIQKAYEKYHDLHVYVTETRPLLQGSRLTTWELKELGIPFTLITDNMAAHVMQTKSIDCVIAGADRIAKNGDSANKIGTYALAVLAKHHHIPFYIAAPVSTIDFNIEHGDEIPIETRQSVEITRISKNKIAPEQINCYNPAFDVTPNELIDAIITEHKTILNKDFNTIKNLTGVNK